MKKTQRDQLREDLTNNKSHSKKNTFDCCLTMFKLCPSGCALKTISFFQVDHWRETLTLTCVLQCEVTLLISLSTERLSDTLPRGWSSNDGGSEMMLSSTTRKGTESNRTMLNGSDNKKQVESESSLVAQFLTGTTADSLKESSSV